MIGAPNLCPWLFKWRNRYNIKWTVRQASETSTVSNWKPFFSMAFVIYLI